MEPSTKRKTQVAVWKKTLVTLLHLQRKNWPGQPREQQRRKQVELLKIKIWFDASELRVRLEKADHQNNSPITQESQKDFYQPGT